MDGWQELEQLPISKIPAAIAFLAARLAEAQCDQDSERVEPATPEALLSLPKIAELLDVPKSTAYELARRGEIRTIRVGKKYLRVHRADFDAFVSGK